MKQDQDWLGVTPKVLTVDYIAEAVAYPRCVLVKGRRRLGTLLSSLPDRRDTSGGCAVGIKGGTQRVKGEDVRLRRRPPPARWVRRGGRRSRGWSGCPVKIKCRNRCPTPKDNGRRSGRSSRYRGAGAQSPFSPCPVSRGTAPSHTADQVNVGRPPTTAARFQQGWGEVNN